MRERQRNPRVGERQGPVRLFPHARGPDPHQRPLGCALGAQPLHTGAPSAGRRPPPVPGGASLPLVPARRGVCGRPRGGGCPRRRRPRWRLPAPSRWRRAAGPRAGRLHRPSFCERRLPRAAWRAGPGHRASARNSLLPRRPPHAPPEPPDLPGRPGARVGRPTSGTRAATSVCPAAPGVAGMQQVPLCAAPLLRADTHCVQTTVCMQSLCADPHLRANTVCRRAPACETHCAAPLLCAHCVQTPACIQTPTESRYSYVCQCPLRTDTFKHPLCVAPECAHTHCAQTHSQISISGDVPYFPMPSSVHALLCG